jgi:hypothetical protein
MSFNFWKQEEKERNREKYQADFLVISFGNGNYPGSEQCSLVWMFNEKIC